MLSSFPTGTISAQGTSPVLCTGKGNERAAESITSLIQPRSHSTTIHLHQLLELPHISPREKSLQQAAKESLRKHNTFFCSLSHTESSREPDLQPSKRTPPFAEAFLSKGNSMRQERRRAGNPVATRMLRQDSRHKGPGTNEHCSSEEQTPKHPHELCLGRPRTCQRLICPSEHLQTDELLLHMTASAPCVCPAEPLCIYRSTPVTRALPPVSGSLVMS